jgi:hypothetical protein
VTEGNWLLSRRLRDAATRIAASTDAAASEALWREAERDVAAAGASEDAAVALPVLERSLPELRALFAAWDAGTAPLPAWDQAVLKRAMNAWRKRLKLTRADDEISSSRNPLSRGQSSGITGVQPPDQYPPEIWALLVSQGRLRDGGHGILESTAPGGA